MAADVLIATVGANCAIEFTQSLDVANNESLRSDDPILWGTHYQAGGSLIGLARSAVARNFLETDAKYLLFIDSDIEFTLENVRQVRKIAEEYHNTAIVGGLVPTCDRQFRQVQWNAFMHENGRFYPLEGVPEEPTEVDSIGTAFMLIPREILETLLGDKPLSAPQFHERANNAMYVGEDIDFCMRAKDAGFKVIAVALNLGHVRTIVLRVR